MLEKLFKKLNDKTINESVCNHKKVIEKNETIEKRINEKNEFDDKEIIENEDKQNGIKCNTKKEENEIIEYQLPPIVLLKKGNNRDKKETANYLVEKAKKLQKTLFAFGVSAKVEDVIVGPTVITYAVKLAEGVSFNKVKKLNEDLAVNLAAKNVNIGIIPEKQLVAIQVEKNKNDPVTLGEMISSEEFKKSKSKLTVGLGKDIYGKNKVIDINETSHMIISGTTGSGKSMFLHTIINSILYKANPNEVKFIMIDTKAVELSIYNGISHMLLPVITDSKKVVGVLAWVVNEIEKRYNLFGTKGIKSIEEYNRQENVLKLPNILLILDEYADLIEYDKKQIEDFIYRITQRGKNVGIFLILAIERPSVNVINGTIKANMPTRVAFRVSSQIDSKVILDTVGAEKLFGNGDMLYKENGVFETVRYQGAFISDSEIEKILDFIKMSETATYRVDMLEYIENVYDKFNDITIEDYDDETDPLLMEVIEAVIDYGQASTSFIQRKLKIGYARAGRIIDQLEERGIISGYQGSKPRQVLMTRARFNELKNRFR